MSTEEMKKTFRGISHVAPALSRKSLSDTQNSSHIPLNTFNILNFISKGKRIFYFI